MAGLLENESDVPPPPEPPPLLDFDGARHLAVHGWLPLVLPQSLQDDLDGLFEAGTVFFDRALADKRTLYPATHATECGFYEVPNEKEYVTFRHRMHSAFELEEIASRLWQQCAQLLHRVLCDLSRAGYYDVHVWDHLLEGALDMPLEAKDIDIVPSLLRLFRYYPEGGIAEEHVDIGLLTLCIGNAPGLQVLDRTTNEYVDAVGPTILVGDFCRALLRNRVRPGKHRVIGNAKGRSSIVFTLRPCLTHPTDLSRFGGKGTVDTRDFFARVKGSKYNINATKDLREKQREKQQTRRSKVPFDVHRSTAESST